jgi:hypothetical protein
MRIRKSDGVDLGGAPPMPRIIAFREFERERYIARIVRALRQSDIGDVIALADYLDTIPSRTTPSPDIEH